VGPGPAQRKNNLKKIILSPALGARNQVCKGLSYRPASLCSLPNQFQTRFLELIPRPIAGLKFRFGSLLTGFPTGIVF
jgi:hypothetical protein